MPRKANGKKSGKKSGTVDHPSGNKSKNAESPPAPDETVASSSQNGETTVSSNKKFALVDSKLLTVFPEEIWLIVLGKVKNTEDFVNISNSSLYLRDLLLPQRESFLFPQVWKVLGIQYERNDHPAYQEDKESATLKQYRLDSGNSREICGYSVILKLCEVCRTWCNCVDEFYRDLDSNCRMNQDASHPLKGYCKWDLCRKHKQDGCWSRHNNKLFNTDELNEFREHFDQTHQGQSRSPFISNKGSLRSGGSGEYTRNLASFLEDYNDHIWYCGMLNEAITFFETYLSIRLLLQFLPNLVSLEVTCGEYGFGPCGDTTELEFLEQDIFQCRMPTLPKLKHLKTESLPAPILDQLLFQNRHTIQMLELERDLLENVFFSFEMPNLTHLSVDKLFESEFQKIGSASWQLQKVYLDFAHCPYIPWSKIFQTVEQKWGQTATEVMLGLPAARTREQILQHIEEHDTLRLCLPKVKRLRIELGTLSSIDFILPMKNSLKQLDIADAYMEQADWIKQLWKFTSFHQTVQQSKVKLRDSALEEGDESIWEIFPKLEVIEHFREGLRETDYPDIIPRTD